MPLLCCSPAPASPEASAAEEVAPGASDSVFDGVTPSPPDGFQEAKRLALELYDDHRRTFYCDCEFSADKSVVAESCGYVPRSDGERAHRIEWEHVVPAAQFGRQRACWIRAECFAADGRAVHGRECCAETDPEFRSMEADLQNLVPEIGELNADRSDYPYGEVEGEPREYGLCDFEVDPVSRIAEPRADLRGDIARIYLYMHAVYGEAALPLGEEELAGLWAHHQADPPDAWEKTRNVRISEIQGEINPLVGVP